MQPHSISLPLEQPNQSLKADLMNQQVFASDDLERAKASPCLNKVQTYICFFYFFCDPLSMEGITSSLGKTKHLFKIFNFPPLGQPNLSSRADLVCAVFWCPNIDRAASAQDFFLNTHTHMLIHVIVGRGLYEHCNSLHWYLTGRNLQHAGPRHCQPNHILTAVFTGLGVPGKNLCWQKFHGQKQPSKLPKWTEMIFLLLPFLLLTEMLLLSTVSRFIRLLLLGSVSAQQQLYVFMFVTFPQTRTHYELFFTL